MHINIIKLHFVERLRFKRRTGTCTCVITTRTYVHVHFFAIYQLRFHNLKDKHVYANFEHFDIETSEMTSFTFIAFT